MVPVTGPAKVTAVVVAPLHKVWPVTAFTEGIGFTVIVKVRGVPTQALAVGVTVIVAVTGALPVLVALKEAMLPLPFAARPIEGSLLVQAYVVPATGFVNVTAVVATPLHKVWLATASTVAVGFTVIVKVRGVPPQALAVGVTVIVAVTGALPVLVALKEAMLPLPFAARPMLGSLFVQA